MPDGVGGGLSAFLAARLDEDEAAARAAKPGAWTADRSQAHGWRVLDSPDGLKATLVAWSPGPLNPAGEAASHATCDHIARHDPARVLREVAAKRAILVLHEVNSEPERWGDSHSDPAMRGQPTGGTLYWCDECDHDRDYGHIGGPSEGCPTVRHLAAVYSDHEGYREEWKP